MSTNSLSGLLRGAASRDNVDLTSTSLPDATDFDIHHNTPPRRPPLSVPSKLSSSRHAFARIPSEMTNAGSLENSTNTPPLQSRLQSFITDMDTPGLDDSIQIDTPAKERKPLEEATNGANGDRRGRASLGGHPQRQMTLREQEKLIDQLRKDNFSLKFKVHLLEERLNQVTPEHMEETVSSNVKLKMEVHSRGVELKKQKKLLIAMEKELSEANERLKDKSAGNQSAVVEQLESELDRKDDEIRDLKKKLKVAEASKSSAYAGSPSQRRLQDEHATLAQRNAELEDELERKEQRLDEAMDELESLRSTLQRHKEDAENDSTRRRLRELERKNDELGKQNASYLSALQEHEEEQSLLHEENESLRAEVEHNRRADVSARSVSRAQLIEEREGREALEESANELRDKWAAAQLELERKEDEIDELHAGAERLEADYQQRIAEYEIALEDRDAQVQELDGQCADLQNTLSELHDKIERTIEHMNQQLAEKEEEKIEEIRIREEELSAANAEVSSLRKTIHALEEDAEDAAARVNELEEELDLLVGREKSLLEKVDEKKRIIEDISQKYEDCRQQLILHSENTVELRREAEQLADELDAERATRGKLEAECDQLDRRLQELEDLLGQAKEDRVRFKKDLEESQRRYKRDVADLEASIKEARADIESLQKMLSQRDQDIVALQSTLNDLESESRKLGESHTTDRFALELELERVRRDLLRAEEDLERVRNDAAGRDERVKEREGAIDKLHIENRELATQLAAQTQARLNLSEKLDMVQNHSKTTEAELAELRTRYADVEKRLSKDQRQLQSQESSYRDQLTERNTLLLTVYHHLEKALGTDKVSKKGAPTTRPLTNFAVFHEEMMNRVRAIDRIAKDFEKRCGAIELKFTDKMNELKRQVENRWNRIDKFEAGLKVANAKHEAMKAKLRVKAGEVEAAQANNAELTNQVSALKRTASSGPGELSAAESKGLMTRVINAERRLQHATNLSQKKDEELLAERQRARQLEERYAARIKELERRSELDMEKLKQEKYGAREAMAVVQKDVELLKDQLAQTKRREEQLVTALEKNKLPSPVSERRAAR